MAIAFSGGVVSATTFFSRFASTLLCSKIVSNSNCSCLKQPNERIQANSNSQF